MYLRAAVAELADALDSKVCTAELIELKTDVVLISSMISALFYFVLVHLTELI